MPACGRVFVWDDAAGDVAREVVAVDGAQRAWDKCDTHHRE